MLTDPQTGVAKGETRGRNMRSRCRCSMCPAIHTNSRSWLRSSSTREPSDPPLRVFIFKVSRPGLAATGRAEDVGPSDRKRFVRTVKRKKPKQAERRGGPLPSFFFPPSRREAETPQASWSRREGRREGSLNLAVGASKPPNALLRYLE